MSERPTVSDRPSAMDGQRYAGGSEGRHPENRGRLLERLMARGWEFDFQQAVWLLERAARDRVPVGGRGPVSREAIRFRPTTSLGFPSTDVSRIRAGVTDDGLPLYTVESTFLGLYGVATPLPLHYAVAILRATDDDAEHDPDSAASDVQHTGRPSEEKASPVRAFLDLLHHRLTSLFYRSGLKYRYHATFGMDGRDAITDFLLLLVGLHPGWTDRTLGVSPTRMIRYAGVLTQHPRSAATLEGILADYWKGLPARVEQAVGRWVPLNEHDLNRMGSMNSRLGVDLTVGSRVYDLGGAFRVTLGPLTWDDYQSFLPDAECFKQTQALVQLFSTDPLSFGIKIRLHAGQVPELRLTSDERAGRLGFTSWARTRDLPETSVTFEAQRRQPCP